MTNRWVVDGRTGHGISRQALTGYIHWLQKNVNKTTGEPVEKHFRKVLRGARRRRNWLMRTGQWPPKKQVADGFNTKMGSITKLQVETE